MSTGRNACCGGYEQHFSFCGRDDDDRLAREGIALCRRALDQGRRFDGGVA